MSAADSSRKLILPEIVPVFPLPDVVLFPSTVLPLHIFEPRYRKMVAKALETDRMIVMALLHPGSEALYFGNPPIFPIACAGHIADSSKLPDGRYEIVLTGVTRVTIEQEIEGEDFRRARVLADPEDRAWIESDQAAGEIQALLDEFGNLSGNVGIIAAGLDIAREPAAREITLNTMALHLNAPALMRQTLLEITDLGERARLLRRFLVQSAEELRILDRFRHHSPEDPEVN